MINADDPNISYEISSIDSDKSNDQDADDFEFDNCKRTTKVSFQGYRSTRGQKDEQKLRASSNDSQDVEEEKLEPVTVLFNSSLSVELVYVILEGIYQFSLINFSQMG